MQKKKSLGQHFLRNHAILAKIVAAADLGSDDTVLEVGPGEGDLTALLLEKARKVVAVEKDDRLIPFLQEKFAAEITAGKLELVHADILSSNPSAYGLMPSAYAIVANLPYYITGQFLRRFLETEAQPASMTLLLQKEVARRIVAADLKESVLSVSIKAYGTPRIIGIVKAGSFSPPPKVDSAIIQIADISKKFFANISEERFFALLKRGFAHPRKLLSSNLGIAPETLQRTGISEKARAEDLSLAQWKIIAGLSR